MKFLKNTLVLLIFVHYVYTSESQSNSTHFLATFEWQEIKPGQKVPQGLHYRINLQTGLKEAKILEPENDKTSLVHVESDKDDENLPDSVNSDVEIENARRRLEDALKNIPAEKFDESTEEQWKEISKKYKSYQEIKEDLKELELSAKTEVEILNQLIEKFEGDLKTEEKLTVLEDIEFLSHSIDNSLHFISVGGLEKIVVPNLNSSNGEILTKSLQILGGIMQNNMKAKSYVFDNTNIPNFLINILVKAKHRGPKSTSVSSSAMFAYGSLIRNNPSVGNELFRKGISVLLDIISCEEAPLSLKTKALVLIGDFVADELNNKEEISKTAESAKLCQNLESFLKDNRNGLIADEDSFEKSLISFSSLKDICQYNWSESPIFRHELLVLTSNFKIQLTEADEDSKYLLTEIVAHTEQLHQFLFSHLKINDDDLSLKYENKIYDEL